MYSCNKAHIRYKHSKQHVAKSFLHYMYVIVMTCAQVQYRDYWHSSDVKPEGRRPEGFMELRANNYGVARALAYVITNLWYELTCLLGYRDIHLRLINFHSEMAF